MKIRMNLREAWFSMTYIRRFWVVVFTCAVLLLPVYPLVSLGLVFVVYAGFNLAECADKRVPIWNTPSTNNDALQRKKAGQDGFNPATFCNSGVPHE